MIERTKEEKELIKKYLSVMEQNDIQILKLWFVDILGKLKSISVSYREFEYALTEGMGLDGSSIEGFARIYESDLVALPDLSTFQYSLMLLPVCLLRAFFATLKQLTVNNLKATQDTF